MRRRLLSVLSMSLLCLTSSWGQDEWLCFNHLEAGITVGTTGLGVEFAMPISDAFRLRAGFSAVPHFRNTTSLEVLLSDQPATPTFDADGNRTDRMGKLFEMMESFTGYQMDERIDLTFKPTMWNGKLLLDWYPTQQKDWHFTAGFYMGPSEVASLCNDPDEMNTLTGMGIYNSMYENILAGKPILSIGGTTVGFPAKLKDKVVEYGRMSAPIGHLSDGSVYSFEPGPDGLIAASVTTRWLRPYIGAGYTYWIGKGFRTAISFDLGCFFWGGKPKLITSDKVDLASDVCDLTGDIKRWVNFYSALRVMPVAEIRFSRRLF